MHNSPQTPGQPLPPEGGLAPHAAPDAQPLAGLPVLVLGHGISGRAMARWCLRLGAAVTVVDSRAQTDLQPSDLPGAEVCCAPFDAALMARRPWHLVCRSPGLPPAQLAAVTQWATENGVPVWGELALFAQGLRRVYAKAGFSPRVLAITGTNGKTTTTALTGLLLQRAGWRVAVAGNIGPALLDVLLAAEENEQKRLLAHEFIGVVATKNISNAPAEAKSGPAGEPPAAPAPDAAPADAVGGLTDEPPPPMPDPAVLAAQAQALAAQVSSLPHAWVLELSSFQLDGVPIGAQGFEPTAAAVLNVTEDHLDWHGHWDHYVSAKQRVYGQQGVRVLNRDDATVMAACPPPPPAPRRGAKAAPTEQPPAWVSFGTDRPRRPGDWGLETVNGMTWLVRAHPADAPTSGNARGATATAQDPPVLQRLMPAEALRIRGRHNAANALAALALATEAGAPLAPMLYGLREYPGEPHRVSPVAVVDGVEYVDDSKGTNVGATLAAITGLGADRRLVLILGGDGKGQDFRPLATAVQAHVRAVVLIGRDAPALRAALADTGVPLHDAADLPQAVRQAAACAREGDAVVLSPACASLDMFRNYAHRAEVFVAAVNEWAAERGMAGGVA